MEAQIEEADHILQDEGLQLEGKRYTWEQLAMEIGADVVGRTMHNVMSAALNYEKCLACVKGWLAGPPMERRVEFAHMMLTSSSMARASAGPMLFGYQRIRQPADRLPAVLHA